MILKALIVDDEPLARQELRYLLGQIDNVEIVGEAAGATEALKLIQALEYDILFLDINLPGINGLELAAKLQGLSNQPKVIFVTAYHQYALNAFEVNAFDYILKPVEMSRLKQAVRKVADFKNAVVAEVGAIKYTAPGVPVSIEAEGAEQPSGAFLTNRITAENKGKIILVNIDDIYYVYTEGESVYIKTYADNMLIRYTLKELEARLSKKSFFRSHRSYIVNINKVKEITPFFNGTYLLVMEDDTKSSIPVSRNQARKLKSMLGH